MEYVPNPAKKLNSKVNAPPPSKTQERRIASHRHEQSANKVNSIPRRMNPFEHPFSLRSEIFEFNSQHIRGPECVVNGERTFAQSYRMAHGPTRSELTSSEQIQN